jgi:hypothetical protein
VALDGSDQACRTRTNDDNVIPTLKHDG